MKSRCSYCGAVYTIKPEFLGKWSLCKNCGRNFLIEALPSPKSPPEPSPPEYLELRPEGSEPPSSAYPGAEGLPAAPRPAEPEELIELTELVELAEPIELTEPAEPEETELEEIWPIQGKPPASYGPSDPAGSGGALAPEAGFQGEGGGRRPLLALAVAAMAGTLVGAGLMGFVRQNEADGLKASLASVGQELQNQRRNRQKLEDLREEMDLVQSEIEALESADYPVGSVPQALTEAAVLEYKTVDALLRQQAVALESGAELTLSARATLPDPKLAEAVEEEMGRLKARLEGLRLEAESLDEEAWSLFQTAIATEELNLAILNRNRLIAIYGLSAPLPPQGPAGGGLF